MIVEKTPVVASHQQQKDSNDDQASTRSTSFRGDGVGVDNRRSIAITDVVESKLPWVLSKLDVLKQEKRASLIETNVSQEEQKKVVVQVRISIFFINVCFCFMFHIPPSSFDLKLAFAFYFLDSI